MHEDLRQLVAALPREQDDPSLAGIRATYRFEVDGVGVCRMRIDDGRLEILEGKGDADAVLYCSPEAFRRVLLGEQNLLTAVLQGAVDLDGDMAQIFTFHQFLKVRQGLRSSDKGKGVSP